MDGVDCNCSYQALVEGESLRRTICKAIAGAALVFLSCMAYGQSTPMNIGPDSYEKWFANDLILRSVGAGIIGGFQAQSEQSYLLLVCKETITGVEILSSQIVRGSLKPAYRLGIKPQIAQLLDIKGNEVSQAFYDVDRELRWVDTKPDSKELEAGVMPALEVVFTVRVPSAIQASTLRLSHAKDFRAFSQRFTSTSAPEFASTDFEPVLSILLADLPGLGGRQK